MLGRHDGVIRYTVGQRRGLGIAAGEPLFVVRLDAENARVIVGPREALATRAIALRDFNWLGDGRAGRDRGAKACRSMPASAPRARRWRRRCGWRRGGRWWSSPASEMGVAPGQACVLYDGDGAEARILGGGVIDAALGGAEHAEAA